MTHPVTVPVRTPGQSRSEVDCTGDGNEDLFAPSQGLAHAQVAREGAAGEDLQQDAGRTPRGRAVGVRARAVSGRLASASEWQVLVVGAVGVRDCLTVAGNAVVESTSAAEHSLGQLGDEVAVVAHQSLLVAEQVRVLGDEGESGHVHGVSEQVERGELGSVQQVHRREGCGSRALHEAGEVEVGALAARSVATCCR